VWDDALQVGNKMSDLSNLPRLKPLHSDSAINMSKLAKMEKLSTEVLVASLREGEGRLKARRDGTILDGHHRIHILRKRGVDVDALPRDIIEKEQEYP
jgi:hypothetical protein